jgi:riboflavin biosynthesis pyrimidine reductase
MAELDPPLETLFADATDDLPDALLKPYGGGLGLARSAVYANFVVSIDGIAAIADLPASSKVIGGQDAGDRFVMALLRASADVVLTGAGTFRQHGGPWTAEAILPGAAEAFAELRLRERRAESPTLAIVTASGKVEPKPGQDTIVLTTAAGAEVVPAGFSEIVAIGDGEAVDAAGAVAALRERGFERILTEGGPNLMGQLLLAGLVDELFLTISPLFAGGGERPGDRSTLTPGIELLPDERVPGTLLSAKRRNSYLFLRVGLRDEATG